MSIHAISILLLLCATPVLVLLNAVVLPRLLTAIAERIRSERPADFSSVFALASAFDSDRSPVWDSQIAMLQLVRQAGPEGISRARLRRAYRAAIRHYPELYDGFTFDQWLRFLLDSKLATRTWRRVRLTRDGMDFLLFALARRDTVAHPSGEPGLARCGIAAD